MTGIHQNSNDNTFCCRFCATLAVSTWSSVTFVYSWRWICRNMNEDGVHSDRDKVCSHPCSGSFQVRRLLTSHHSMFPFRLISDDTPVMFVARFVFLNRDAQKVSLLAFEPFLFVSPLPSVVLFFLLLPFSFVSTLHKYSILSLFVRNELSSKCADSFVRWKEKFLKLTVGENLSSLHKCRPGRQVLRWPQVTSLVLLLAVYSD